MFHGHGSGAVRSAGGPPRGRRMQRGRRASQSVGRPARREMGQMRSVSWRERSPRRGQRWSSERTGRAPRRQSEGWRGPSPRRARSPRRRSPVRTGMPGVRSRRSRSPSRRRSEGRRARRESPAGVRVSRHGRSPRRRTAPQKRPRQESEVAQRVCVRTEVEGSSRVEAVSAAVQRTSEEVHVVIGEPEEKVVVAVEKVQKERRVVTVEERAEEERRVVAVEERAGEEKESGGDRTAALCVICGVSKNRLRRHVESMHLPCFFRPEFSCWKCEWAECSSLHLSKRHWEKHVDEGNFTDERLPTWCKSVKEIFELIACKLGRSPESLGRFVQGRGWLNNMEPTVSVSREMLGKQLAAYWRGTVENVATPSPCDVAAVLQWRVMMRLLAELPEEARAQVRQAPLLGDAEGEMLRSMAIDGHCHLELMRRRFSLNSTLESLLGTLAVNHASPVMSGLEAVVTNAVFREEWDTTMLDFIGDIRVLKTWGVHSKAVRDVNWQWIERKMASLECIETARDMTLQEEVFNRQVRIAQRLDKSLILHLRGLNAKTTSALYGWALALITPVLKKRHKIYRHSFSAGLAEFQLWYRSFSNLLVGCSWLTTSDFSRMDLLRVLPTTVIALETDSPHLSSRVGVVNSPYRVYEQAAAIGEIRNLPTSTVLECSNRALRQFYALWIGPRERFLTWVNEKNENETRMDKLHIIPTLLWIFGSNFSGIFETD